MRYATREGAGERAVSRLRTESIRMPAVLTNALYFDAALDALFVKPRDRARPLLRTRRRSGRDRRRRARGGVLGAAGSAISSAVFQTGLVRAYALILAFGVGVLRDLLRADRSGAR